LYYSCASSALPYSDRRRRRRKLCECETVCLWHQGSMLPADRHWERAALASPTALPSLTSCGCSRRQDSCWDLAGHTAAPRMARRAAVLGTQCKCPCFYTETVT